MLSVSPVWSRRVEKEAHRRRWLGGKKETQIQSRSTLTAMINKCLTIVFKQRKLRFYVKYHGLFFFNDWIRTILIGLFRAAAVFTRFHCQNFFLENEMRNKSRLHSPSDSLTSDYWPHKSSYRNTYKWVKYYELSITAAQCLTRKLFIFGFKPTVLKAAGCVLADCFILGFTCASF